MPPLSTTTLSTATIELGDLLHEYQLELVLLAGVDSHTATLPVQWVHVSELHDPTPFLTPRTVLLTTGARLSTWGDQDQADAYVARLLGASVTALGVAVGLHWDRVPAILVAACDRLGLPLFRVPYDTSFIAISQAAARLLSARAHERDLWALGAQRAVSRAALRRDGLEAAVRESAAQLGKWVALTDRAGHIVEFAPRSARGEVDADWIRREARAFVARDVRAGGVRERMGVEIELQTLGSAGQLLGVLVTPRHGAPDHAERTLTGLLVALATMQLEHRSGITDSASALRSSVIELLTEGRTELAERVSRGILTRLPRGRVAVIRFAETADDSSEFADDLRSVDGATPGMLVAVSRGLILCELAALAPLKRVFQTHAVPAGVSERGQTSHIARLIDQADIALERATLIAPAEDCVVTYEPALHGGVLTLLSQTPAAAQRAETLLAPIRAFDRGHEHDLEDSLHTWLRHHGQTSPAAAELGIHRHTLKTRVQTAASLVQLDLDSPDARAELWAALRVDASRPDAVHMPGSRTV